LEFEYFGLAEIGVRTEGILELWNVRPVKPEIGNYEVPEFEGSAAGLPEWGRSGRLPSELGKSVSEIWGSEGGPSEFGRSLSEIWGFEGVPSEFGISVSEIWGSEKALPKIG
jgi:hypothetical protein